MGATLPTPCEPAGYDAGRSEERRRERGQQELRTRHWISSARDPCVEDAGGGRNDARGDQRPPSEAPHIETAEPRNAPTSPNEQQLSPERGVLKEVPEHDD